MVTTSLSCIPPPMDISLFSSLFFVVTPFLLLFFANKYYTSVQNLPPGPRPWPIIGNLHQLGKMPHVSAATIAQEYGPLISLRLGTQLLVVASSPKAAMGILKTQDRFLSGRAVPDVLQQSFKEFYFVWANDCNEYWKSLRILCRSELFSPKALENQSILRNTKLTQMLDFLDTKQGKVVKIEHVVFTTLFNTLSNIIFSKDLLDLNDERGTAHGLKWGLLKILKNATSLNMSDIYPIVRGLDLQGLRRDTLKHHKAMSRFMEGLVEERRAQIASSVTQRVVVDEEKDFLDRLLENNFTNSQINLLVLELFLAGTDTMVTTIEWAMIELLKNKEIMKKVHQELKTEINSNSIMDYDLSKLTYFNACIKETLRLHPVLPLLIPRRALETCEVMNYTIPKTTQIWINIWAISRDPKVWDDPHTFNPERFLGSNLDFKGQNFEFIPFGSGRRVCPGLPFGIINLQTVLASLILRFDWVLPNATQIDMNEKFAVTWQKEKALELFFNKKE